MFGEVSGRRNRLAKSFNGVRDLVFFEGDQPGESQQAASTGEARSAVAVARGVAHRQQVIQTECDIQGEGGADEKGEGGEVHLNFGIDWAEVATRIINRQAL